MNKRLAKRHKRQVARGREKLRLSHPDLRTPEQIGAARQASQPAGGWRNGADHAHYLNPAAPTAAEPKEPEDVL